MRLRLLSLLAPAFVLTLILPAQTSTTGLLTGTVKDPSGAVAPNAKLTLLSHAGEERTGTTTADGSYRFPLLPPGSYTLTVEAAGFQTLNVAGIAIHPEKLRRGH